MGIPVQRGRDVVDSDAEVLLVSQDAVKLYWGEDDPIERRAALPFSKTVLRQVVGIVGDVKQRSLTEGPTPTAYYYTREPSGRATFVVRTSVPPATLAPARRCRDPCDRSGAASRRYPDDGAGARRQTDAAAR
jgi:hypothetical protein